MKQEKEKELIPEPYYHLLIDIVANKKYELIEELLKINRISYLIHLYAKGYKNYPGYGQAYQEAKLIGQFIIKELFFRKKENDVPYYEISEGATPEEIEGKFYCMVSKALSRQVPRKFNNEKLIKTSTKENLNKKFKDDKEEDAAFPNFHPQNKDLIEQYKLQRYKLNKLIDLKEAQLKIQFDTKIDNDKRVLRSMVTELTQNIRLMKNSHYVFESTNPTLVYIDEEITNEDGETILINDIPDFRTINQYDDLISKIDINNAINQLSNEEHIKDVILEVYQQKTAKEISEIIGISPEAVNRRKVRGIKIMKENLNN